MKSPVIYSNACEYRTVSPLNAPVNVVHLPVYEENPYQPLLMESLSTYGVVATSGGGGGNFFRTALLKWRADILHFHWLHPYLLRNGYFLSALRATRFIFEVALLRMSGSRIVWTVHNLVNHERRFPTLERFYTRLFAWLADGIIVHSRHALRAAEGSFKFRKGTVKAIIPQGSYYGHYPNKMTREESRVRLGLGADEMVFLFLGHIRPYKGVLELIGCFKQLPGNARLLIVGRACNAQSLKPLSEAMDGAHNIRLCEGFVPNDALEIYLNAADVFVLPVCSIFNSGSILLAMSFGLPCIAPRLGGLPETLREDGGILYDPTQPDGLRAALQLAIRRKSELSQSGRANLQRAKNWTWDQVADRTAAVYSQCLGVA
jgi:beta-1,4-mannosyltransferase